MITLEISKSKYAKWINEQLQEIETLDELKDIGYYVPDFTVVKGFNDTQEFLMDTNKDNPIYFSFLLKR